MLSYVLVLALAAASGVQAATDNCVAVAAFAEDNLGNCKIVAACNDILTANAGFDANSGADSNDGFEANDGAIANDGFEANDGAIANDGFEANDGAIANDGFEANDGAIANDGFEANDGAIANDGFEANDGAIANDGFVNIDAALCQALIECGEFSVDGTFGDCAVPTPTDDDLVEPTSTEGATTETKCFQAWIGDGFCDVICNTAEFNYDGGDCLTSTDIETSTTEAEVPTTTVA